MLSLCDLLELSDDRLPQRQQPVRLLLLLLLQLGVLDLEPRPLLGVQRGTAGAVGAPALDRVRAAAQQACR